MTRVRVVGCGNPDAGDDALGLLAVRAARSRLEAIAGVEVVEVGLALRVVDLADGVDALVVVDAVRAPVPGGRAPGTLVRVEAGPEGLPADLGSSLSSHGFGVGEAVGLVSALGQPLRLLFLGVEAADATMGAPLSPAVEAAVSALVEAVVAEAEALSRR